MRIIWIILIVLSFIVIGCGPSVQVKKTYVQVNQQTTGPVDIFSSFDAVGKSYKNVAELEVNDKRNSKNRNRNQMIESLKTKTSKVGADGIVITEEGESVIKHPDPFGDKVTIDQDCIFIKGMAIKYL